MQYHIDNREVDAATCTVADVNTQDYPDFSDAYIETACFIDGGELSDDELETLAGDYPELVNELAYESMLGGY